MSVNDWDDASDVEAQVLLVYFIRDYVVLTGTHIGCDTSQCGACTVLMDGKTVKSCTVLSIQAQGHRIRTIEGVSSPQQMTPFQEAFQEQHALQCGPYPLGGSFWPP